MAVATSSASIRAYPMVRGTGQTQQRQLQEIDHRRHGAKTTGSALEIHRGRCCHRRCDHEKRLILLFTPNLHNLQSLICSGKSRSTNRLPTIANCRTEEWSHSPEPCPPHAGSWCSRNLRRPYVSLIRLGNEPRHASGLGTWISRRRRISMQD